MLTLPINERSFSKLKLIKIYLRSAMGQERLSNLAILSIVKAIWDAAEFDQFIEKFCSTEVSKVNMNL